MSTSGLTAGSSPGTSDITRAITNQEITPFKAETRRRVRRSWRSQRPCCSTGRVAGVMRLVTSMKLVDRQIVLVVFIILAVGGICMALVLISSLLFINKHVVVCRQPSREAITMNPNNFGQAGGLCG